jgi:hypothetical protein
MLRTFGSSTFGAREFAALTLHGTVGSLPGTPGVGEHYFGVPNMGMFRPRFFNQRFWHPFINDGGGGGGDPGPAAGWDIDEGPDRFFEEHHLFVGRLKHGKRKKKVFGKIVDDDDLPMPEREVPEQFRVADREPDIASPAPTLPPTPAAPMTQRERILEALDALDAARKG